jgi:hypothetical protein
MTKYIRPALVSAALALCLGVVACGPTTTGAVGGNGMLPSSGPVSLDLGVDVSQTTADETLRRQYLAAGMKAAQTVLDRGGHIAISVFFSSGLHPVSLLDAEVPTPDEIGGITRAQRVVPIREAAVGILAEALELEPRRPEVAQALTGLGGAGTDVAGSFAAGLAAVDSRSNPVVVRLTDGIDARWVGDLQATPQTLAERVGPVLPHTNQDVTVALVGIGDSVTGTSTRTTERLLAAWRLACQRTGAHCYVAPDLDLSRLLG